MKKIFAILILLTLTVLAVFPTAAFAEESASAETSSTDWETSNLRLVNPVAICAIGDKLFIADNVTENNSIVMCFDVATENSPKYLFIESVEKPIVNLSETNGKLAVIHADGVDKYEISESGLTLNNEGSQIVNAVGIVDVTYGHITVDSEIDTEFYIGGEISKVYACNSKVQGLTDTPSPLACLEFENFVYFLYQNGDQIVCRRFDESGYTYDTTETFNTNTTLGLIPKGILGCTVDGESKLVLYSDTSLCFMTATKVKENVYSAYYFESVNTLFNYTELTKKDDSNKIVDACSNGSKVFVLNDKNEVEIFSQTQSEEGGNKSKFVLETATIGTDTIKFNDISLPKVDDFNSYTLAKSTGYPTNIVYKTEDITSIDDIKTDYSDTFIILGFDGAENLPFYYVLVGNSFGWVKKSDNVTVAENDEKIEIINTTSNFLVGSVPVDVTQKLKFISAGDVTVFHLPVKKLADDTSTKDTFSQTLDTAQDVTVLQKFTEKTEDGKTVAWYYVEYGEGKRGFVQEGTIGKFYFYTAATSEGISYIDDMKINASLFEGVKIYLSEDMSEDDCICDAQGNVLKLRSGAKVKAIKKNADGAATYIEVTDNNETSYGWIPTENVIGRHNVTTNAAVGLCILAAASFCALVLLLLFKHRNKKEEFEDEE